MTAESILRALHGRHSRCQCPACADHGRDAARNHLAVTERGGTVLVHCFAGCDQRTVIDALRARGLWPERERPAWTHEERRAWARARAAREGELDDLIERRARWVSLLHKGRAAIRKHGVANVAADWVCEAILRLESDVELMDRRIDELKGRV